MWFAAGFALVVGLGAYVRLAPADAARWNALPLFEGDRDLPGGVYREVTGVSLADLDAIIRAEPRTDVLVGSVSEGQITYVTRSLIWGFPDYTTVAQTDAGLRLFARLRFGRADLGVNKARVARWLKAL